MTAWATHQAVFQLDGGVQQANIFQLPSTQHLGLKVVYIYGVACVNDARDYGAIVTAETEAGSLISLGRRIEIRIKGKG